MHKIVFALTLLKAQCLKLIIFKKINNGRINSCVHLFLTLFVISEKGLGIWNTTSELDFFLHLTHQNKPASSPDSILMSIFQ